MLPRLGREWLSLVAAAWWWGAWRPAPWGHAPRTGEVDDESARLEPPGSPTFRRLSKTPGSLWQGPPSLGLGTGAVARGCGSVGSNHVGAFDSVFARPLRVGVGLLDRDTCCSCSANQMEALRGPAERSLGLGVFLEYAPSRVFASADANGGRPCAPEVCGVRSDRFPAVESAHLVALRGRGLVRLPRAAAAGRALAPTSRGRPNSWASDLAYSSGGGFHH